MFSKMILAATVAALTFTAPALAQETMDHSKMDHSNMDEGSMDMGAPKGDTGPSSTAFAKANATMHEGMDITFTGNTDVDFVSGMIAHHQGAIDMAKIELEYGKDEALRKLATEIIAAQEGEIKMMKDWLAKNGG
ncbi:CopM family metallochaperone [Pararhizobium sp.]|uniref:CopM family metallochaperone n=1 Tax=Pararhizobium sp. TaxID=1977563 RepID=UPI002724F3F2|nr:DUF305 domain-containing protein [Pararhizobium sp.]MDO9415615.1 DUF305 domain-containing protein [Pararhizobium sp.]